MISNVLIFDISIVIRCVIDVVFAFEFVALQLLHVSCCKTDDKSPKRHGTSKAFMARTIYISEGFELSVISKVIVSIGYRGRI